jgi:hypothetical protein
MEECGGMSAVEQKQLLAEQMQEVRALEVWHVAAVGYVWSVLCVSKTVAEILLDSGATVAGV